jgi:hypothetical protein
MAITLTGPGDFYHRSKRASIRENRQAKVFLILPARAFIGHEQRPVVGIGFKGSVENRK